MKEIPAVRQEIPRREIELAPLHSRRVAEWRQQLTIVKHTYAIKVNMTQTPVLGSRCRYHRWTGPGHTNVPGPEYTICYLLISYALHREQAE